MSEHDIQQEIQSKVLERIRGGKTHMRSRAYFVARIVVTAAVALLALAVSAFVLSFIIFSIHASGEAFLLGFGARGIFTFFALFPWLSLIFDIALLIMLEWLLQGFRFGYRVSLLTMFVVVFAASALLGVLTELTPLHSTLLDRADRGGLPLIGEAYESIRDSHQDKGVYRGTVASVAGDQIVVMHNDGDHDPDDGTWACDLPPESGATLRIGDRIYVFGTKVGNVVQALGFQKLSPDQ